MANASPVTRAAREALLAQLFADVDALLQRVEELPTLLDAAGLRMDTAAETITHQCGRLTALTVDLQQATREELNALLRRRADEAAATAAARAGEQIRDVIQSAIAEGLRQQVTQLIAQVAHERFRDRARWRFTIAVLSVLNAGALASTAWAILAR